MTEKHPVEKFRAYHPLYFNVYKWPTHCSEVGYRFSYMILANMCHYLILGVLSFMEVTRGSPVRRDVGEFVFGADLNAPGMMVPGTADVMMANLCGQNPDTGI